MREGASDAASDVAWHAHGGPSADRTAMAYEQIEDLFVSMRLAPGSSLRTQDIQTLVGLGRTPVHQAVRRLGAETLLEIRPRNGLRVAPIDLARERRLAILRRDLIRFVTDAAMRNMSANDRSRIHYLRRQLVSDERAMTVERFNEIDKSFDILLIQASGERFLERALRPLHAIARRLGYLHLTRLSGADGICETVAHHVAIMDAVLAGDGRKARKMCDELISFGIRFIDDVEDAIDPHWLDVSYAPISGRSEKASTVPNAAESD